MLRMGADRVRTKFRVESTDTPIQYGILFKLAEIGGDSTERVLSQYGCNSG